eukprot:686138-Rhodomonas_salina.4
MPLPGRRHRIRTSRCKPLLDLRLAMRSGVFGMRCAVLTSTGCTRRVGADRRRGHQTLVSV